MFPNTRDRFKTGLPGVAVTACGATSDRKFEAVSLCQTMAAELRA